MVSKILGVLLYSFAVLYVSPTVRRHHSGHLFNLVRFEWSTSNLGQKAATSRHQSLLSSEFNPSLPEATLFTQTYLVSEVYAESPSTLTLTFHRTSGYFCSAPLINSIYGAGRRGCGHNLCYFHSRDFSDYYHIWSKVGRVTRLE